MHGSRPFHWPLVVLLLQKWDRKLPTLKVCQGSRKSQAKARLPVLTTDAKGQRWFLVASTPLGVLVWVFPQRASRSTLISVYSQENLHFFSYGVFEWMVPPNTSCLSSVTQGQDKSKGERKERRKRRKKERAKAIYGIWLWGFFTWVIIIVSHSARFWTDT